MVHQALWFIHVLSNKTAGIRNQPICFDESCRNSQSILVQLLWTPHESCSVRFRACRLAALPPSLLISWHGICLWASSDSRVASYNLLAKAFTACVAVRTLSPPAWPGTLLSAAASVAKVHVRRRSAYLVSSFVPFIRGDDSNAHRDARADGPWSYGVLCSRGLGTEAPWPWWMPGDAEVVSATALSFFFSQRAPHYFAHNPLIWSTTIYRNPNFSEKKTLK